ncbi:hypothetical protein BDR06DRAFT_977838 [Suillus hirtellus]|nr:hypothetical protein BDR06DRAFT_977838 [Suillus hirtellus]
MPGVWNNCLSGHESAVISVCITTIVREAGLDDLLLNSKTSATQPPVQQHPPAYRVPQGFFDGVPPNGSHVLEPQPGLARAPALGRLIKLLHMTTDITRAHSATTDQHSAMDSESDAEDTDLRFNDICLMTLDQLDNDLKILFLLSRIEIQLVKIFKGLK